MLHLNGTKYLLLGYFIGFKSIFIFIIAINFVVVVAFHVTIMSINLLGTPSSLRNVFTFYWFQGKSIPVMFLYTFFVCLPTKDLDKGFIQTVYSNSERISFVTLASLYIKGTSIGTMFMFVDCEIVSVKCLMKVRDVSRCVTFLET